MSLTVSTWKHSFWWRTPVWTWTRVWVNHWFWQPRYWWVIWTVQVTLISTIIQLIWWFCTTWCSRFCVRFRTKTIIFITRSRLFHPTIVTFPNRLKKQCKEFSSGYQQLLKLTIIFSLSKRKQLKERANYNNLKHWNKYECQDRNNAHILVWELTYRQSMNSII